MLEKIDVNKFQDKIEWLWEHYRTQSYAIDDTAKDNYQPFLINLFRPDSEHYYNESGMVSVVAIQPRLNANIHFVLWDRRYPLRQIVAEGQKVFSNTFHTYHLARLTATIPACNKGATRLATLLGMKFEGTMRECFLHDGRYWDLYIYGILRREFEEVPIGRIN